MISISQQARYLMTRLGLTLKKLGEGGLEKKTTRLIVAFLPAKFNELPTTVVHTPLKHRGQRKIGGV